MALNNKQKSLQSNISLLDNGKPITNEKEVANTFNKYFINVADNLTKDLGESDANIHDYLKNPNRNTFFTSPTTQEEVLEILLELDPNKATDIYKISPKYAIDSRFFLSDVLGKLFNKSVEENKFPEYLKLGEVALVHKGKSKMDHVNYRPISILPIFSKVVEKLMYKTLISFIQKYKILFPLQYGFQEGKSTEQAINTLMNKVTESLDNKMDSSTYFWTLPRRLTLLTTKYYLTN